MPSPTGSSPRRRGAIIRSLLLLAAVSRLAVAQSSATADSAFLRSDWVTAAREYRALAARDSASTKAYFRLGIALFEQRQFRDAITALQRSVAAQYQLPQSEFRLTRAYAQLGQADSALAHLDRAITAGVRFRQVTSQPDLTPLHRNARYLSTVARLEDSTFPCRRGADAHRFDFWIGDWVVTPWGAPAAVPPIGRNTITAHLEHCLLLEEWTAADGSTGKSFNFWDVNRKTWRQVWTSGDGQSLDYEGQFSDSAMRFTGWTLNPGGVRVLQKLTFFRISADTVRQLFEASSDGGATWQHTFDGRYVRAAGTASKP